MARTFDFARTGTYYRRFRSLPAVVTDADGAQALTAPLDLLTTRWGYQASRYRRATDAYHDAASGTWYRIDSRIALEFAPDGTPAAWAHAFTPIDSAVLYDRYPCHTVDRGDVPLCRIVVKGGRAARVDMYDPAAVETRARGGKTYRVRYDKIPKGGGVHVIWTPADGLEYLNALLGLDAVKRRSPKRAA